MVENIRFIINEKRRVIPEFHHIDGVHYILDIYELLDTDEYEIYDEEDSFVLIPKNHVKRVFYVE